MENYMLEVHDGTKPLQAGFLRVVCMSDTHNSCPQAPAGDILIHAGDFSNFGHPNEISNFNHYLGRLDFAHKVVIAGNHDTPFDIEKYQFNCEYIPELDGVEAKSAKELLTNCTYLEDSFIEIGGYKIYGSPWVYAPFAGAFIREKGVLQEKWESMPADTDILITHSPPYGIADEIRGKSVGCKHLAEKVKQVKPLLHVFGHIHEGRGHYYLNDVNYINAAICNPWNIPTHSVIAFDLPRRN